MTEQEVKDYNAFLEHKKQTRIESGFEVEESELNPQAFDFQKFCVKRMLKMGKGAVFAGCGNGKTLIQLDWAQKVADHTQRPVLILCPLAVSAQTIHEGETFGYKVIRYKQMDEGSQIVVTNYQQLENIDVDIFLISSSED